MGDEGAYYIMRERGGVGEGFILGSRGTPGDRYSS